MDKREDRKLVMSLSDNEKSEDEAIDLPNEGGEFSHKFNQAECWFESEDTVETAGESEQIDEGTEEFFENFDPLEAIKQTSETSSSERNGSCNSPNEQQILNETMLKLSPRQSLENIKELYQQLQTILRVEQDIAIDASAVTFIDAATLQLLAALKQTAVTEHKSLTINFPSGQFIEAAQLLGMEEWLDIDQASAGLF